MAYDKKKLEDIARKGYNRDNFIDYFGAYKDVSDGTRTLEKDGNNPGARQDIGNVVHGDTRWYAGKPADIARAEGEKESKWIITNLGKYTSHNLDSFLGKINERGLLRLVYSLPSFKTGNAEHDKTYSLKKELESLKKVIDDNDVNAMRAFVIKNLEERGEKALLSAFLNYTSGYDPYVKELFNKYATITESEFQKKFMSDTGLNKDKLKEYIKEDVRGLEKEIKAETNEGDKSDLTNFLNNAFYDPIGRVVHPKEKDDKRREDEPGRYTRQQRRAEKGIPL